MAQRTFPVSVEHWLLSRFSLSEVTRTNERTMRLIYSNSTCYPTKLIKLKPEICSNIFQKAKKYVSIFAGFPDNRLKFAEGKTCEI